MPTRATANVKNTSMEGPGDCGARDDNSRASNADEPTQMEELLPKRGQRRLCGLGLVLKEATRSRPL